MLMPALKNPQNIDLNQLNMPLISVIIPVYNGEKTIQATIQSVQQQTYPNLEIIVINDGSTDCTITVIEALADTHIRLFSQSNSGQAMSRNYGATMANGEYLSFLDADDLWTPEKLIDQYQALQSVPQAMVAYSWTDHIDEQGNFLRHGPQLSFTGNVLRQLIYSDFIGSGSNILVQRSAFLNIGGFEASLPPAEDWDCWLRLAKHYPFAVVPKPQILYRVSSQSSSFNIWRMERSSLKVIERTFHDLPSPLQPLKTICLGHRYKYLTYKAIDRQPDHGRAITGFRYLLTALFYDPTLWKRRVIWKVLLKLCVITVLPKTWSIQLFSKFDKIFNIEALLYHIKFS